MAVELLPDSLPLLLFIVGIAIAAFEAIAPGAHLIVVGVALMLAGLLGLLVGPLGTPVALAVTTLLFGAITFYIYREFEFYEGQGTGRTRDSDSLKGAVGRVTERITANGGEVKLREGGFNPYYRALSMDEDIPTGTEVMVIDPGGGNVVTVTPLEELEDDIDRELAADRARGERERETDT